MSDLATLGAEAAAFGGGAPRVAAEGAIAGDDAMARHEIGPRVAFERLPDGTRGVGLTDLLRDPPI